MCFRGAAPCQGARKLFHVAAQGARELSHVTPFHEVKLSLQVGGQVAIAMNFKRVCPFSV